MVGRADGHATNGSASVTVVEIDPKLLEVLDSLPDNTKRGHEWSEQEDAVLRKYWMIKRKDDVARVLGMDCNTCRKRYREITS